MDQMDYLHFNYLKGVFTSLLEFTSSRCEQVENSHSILNDFALAQLRFAIQTINKRYGNLNKKSMTSLKRTIVQLIPWLRSCWQENDTSPIEKPNWQARTIISIWKTYPFDTHESTNFWRTGFLYNLKTTSNDIVVHQKLLNQTAVCSVTLLKHILKNLLRLRGIYYVLVAFSLPKAASEIGGVWSKKNLSHIVGTSTENKTTCRKNVASICFVTIWKCDVTYWNLMIFLLRSQPWTPPEPEYLVPLTRSKSCFSWSLNTCTRTSHWAQITVHALHIFLG